MNKTIYELSNGILGELESLGYGEHTRNNFKYFWNAMAQYFESKGVDEYDADLAMEYLEVRFSEKNLAKRTKNFIRRAISILEYYNTYGTIAPRQSYSISKLNNSKLRELLNSYSNSFEDCEYSNTTIDNYLRQTTFFLQFAEQKKYYNVSEWSSEIIFEYISTLSKFRPATIKNRLGALRLFLKYVYFNGFNKENLSKFAGSVRGTYHQKIPSIWTKTEVNQMLNVIDRGNPNEKRDYAMILIVARLGLRSIDVKKLKFENFNWVKNEITLNQSKTGAPITLPLLRDVGWAIIDYIQNGRPKSDNPHIFLKHMAPYSELSEDNHLYKTIEKYMLRAKLPISSKRKNGMHSLRHTLATTLLEENIPLDEISSILGHASIESTSVYLNTNIERLRECSLDTNKIEVM